MRLWKGVLVGVTFHLDLVLVTEVGAIKRKFVSAPDELEVDLSLFLGEGVKHLPEHKDGFVGLTDV